VFATRPACPVCRNKENLKFDHTRRDDETVESHATCPCGQRFIVAFE
jgi:hypothetical protein